MKGRKFNLTIAILIAQILAPLVMSMEKWHKLNDIQIFIEPHNKVNWFEAMNECARRNMSLITVDSAAKSSALTDHLTAMFDSAISLWIGGNDLGSEGYFVWSLTGKPFEFTNWNAHEPSNSKDEHCVHLYLKTFMWNDINCNTKLGFICEENPFEASARRKVKLLQNVMYDILANCED